MYLLDLDKCDLARGWLSLRQVTDSSKMEYAILSHRWSDDEVLFSDIENANAAHKKGFSKIAGTILKARSYGHQYLWVDSCCIDKKSSAELSEAINSMFKWYQQAIICYVYLQDVQHPSDVAEVEKMFCSSVWWSRGWTLQELLAPSEVVFYMADWCYLGTKANRVEEISEWTGIASEYLLCERALSGASVATRMSWASKRVTERTEDVAYSLMGIFSVNMSLLYGEGQRAFHRLQEEILRSTDDQSLFAWHQHTSASYWKPHGLLADSPEVFEDSGGILPYSDWAERKPSMMTSKGIQLQLGIKMADHPGALWGSKYIYHASLLCQPVGSDSGFVAISILPTAMLRHCLPDCDIPDRYVRIEQSKMHSTATYGEPKNIFALPDTRAMRGVASTPLVPYHNVLLRLSESHNGIRSFGALYVSTARNSGPKANFTDLAVDLKGFEDATKLQQSSNIFVRVPKWRQGPEVIIAFRHGQAAPGLDPQGIFDPSNPTQLRSPSPRALLVIIGTSKTGQIGFDVKCAQLAGQRVGGDLTAPRVSAPPFEYCAIGKAKTVWDERGACSSTVSVKELKYDSSGNRYDCQTLELEIQESEVRPSVPTMAGSKRRRDEVDACPMQCVSKSIADSYGP